MDCSSTIVPSPTATLLARSERQALDWSLVLISQGIQSHIDYAPEMDRWRIEIAASDLTRARQSLKDYRRENLQRALKRPVVYGRFRFDGRAVAWFLALGAIHTIATGLYSVAQMDSQAVRSGEWWRLWTGVMLHADWPHLAANATSGTLFLGLAMGRYGSGWGFLGAMLAGVAGNVLGYFAYRGPHLGVGASGLVLGCLGMLIPDTFSQWREHGRGSRLTIAGLLAGMMLFFTYGANTEARTDVIGHLGGFVMGFLWGVGWQLTGGGPAPRRFDGLMQFAAAAITVIAWGMALHWGHR